MSFYVILQDSHSTPIRNPVFVPGKWIRETCRANPMDVSKGVIIYPLVKRGKDKFTIIGCLMGK